MAEARAVPQAWRHGAAQPARLCLWRLLDPSSAIAVVCCAVSCCGQVQGPCRAAQGDPAPPAAQDGQHLRHWRQPLIGAAPQQQRQQQRCLLFSSVWRSLVASSSKSSSSSPCSDMVVFAMPLFTGPYQLCLGQGGVRAECLLCCVVDNQQPDTLRAEVLATAATRSRSLGFGWWVSEPVAWRVEGCAASDTQVAGLWQL